MAETTHPLEDEQNAHAFARVGTKLGGKWTLQRILGIGGMAAVFEAEHDNGLRVAIKVLHPELSHVAEAKERFLDEAYIANHVAHSGTVPVLDDGIADDGLPFLVMELLDGETLQDRWQRSEAALPVLEVFRLIEPLLDILRAAHQRGIVHRDLKPDNVFLTATGEVKLLDFGIARMAESHRSLKTQFGATMGTPEYMAPEQARGRWEDVDEQSDIWSLGATMFALICGRTVHLAERSNELLLACMTEHAPPIGEVATDVPEIAAAVIDRALAFEKTHRYASAEEMLNDVRYVTQALERARPERDFASLPPQAWTPSETLHASMPPPASTFRPVTRNEQPANAQESVSPRTRRRHRALIAAIALGTSALMGYFAVSTPTINEAAPSAAQREWEPADLPRVETSPEAVSVPSGPSPIPEKTRTRLSDTSLKSTIEGTPPTPSPDAAKTTAGEKAIPPGQPPASNHAQRPVQQAATARPAGPAKKSTSRDPEPELPRDENNVDSFDPLRMRR